MFHLRHARRDGEEGPRTERVPLPPPPATRVPERDRLLSLVAEWAVPAAYAVVTLLFSVHLRRFEAGPDEGMNLAKAFLLARGHALYAEVWSDQPPLLTEALRALFAVTGESVRAARLLVLGCSCALLWACARVARLAWGPREALAAQFLLLVAPPFQPLSVAVMVGLPAIAFAAAALACAGEAHARRSATWAVLSGALLGLGVLTKLFVAFLVPILPAGLARAAPRGSRGRAVLAFAAGFLATTTLGFLAFAGPGAVGQLVSPHLAAATDPAIRADATLGLLHAVRRLWWLGALAAAGAAVTVRRGAPVATWVLAWGLLALVALAVHRPVWDHHVLLLTVPASLLGGAAAAAAARGLARAAGPALDRLPGARVVLALGAAFGAAWLLSDAGRWRRPRPPGLAALREEALLTTLRSVARPGDRIVTDRPIHAFRAGIAVLPETAVLSAKRLRTGLLTETRLLEIVDRQRPDLVLLGRFALPALREALRATWTRVHSVADQELFVRDAARAAAAPCTWPDCLGRPLAWYGGAEARGIAENILLAQHTDGGWSKGEDRRARPPAPDPAGACDGTGFGGCSTIDNDATTAEMRFLARVHAASGDARFAEAFLRGLDHLLAAQTPTGGWPQVPAARAGTYHAAITLNDDAMAHVMALLRDVAAGGGVPLVDAARRERARAAFDRGIACLVAAQVPVDGVPTVWCAQHDPVTLAPVGARTYEPASLSGLESVGAVRVLMSVDAPSPEVVASVEAAVRWFRAARRVDPGDGVPRWARFYDLETGAPVFADRDGTRKPSWADLSEERRTGYRYFTDLPGTLLDADHPRWLERVRRGR